MCHVSHVMCNMSPFFLNFILFTSFFLNIAVKLVSGGSAISRAYSVYFLALQHHKSLLCSTPHCISLFCRQSMVEVFWWTDTKAFMFNVCDRPSKSHRCSEERDKYWLLPWQALVTMKYMPQKTRQCDMKPENGQLKDRPAKCWNPGILGPSHNKSILRLE